MPTKLKFILAKVFQTAHQPATGSARYALELNLPKLRSGLLNEPSA